MNLYPQREQMTWEGETKYHFNGSSQVRIIKGTGKWSSWIKLKTAETRKDGYFKETLVGWARASYAS